jgi:hypothetical protein
MATIVHETVGYLWKGVAAANAFYTLGADKSMTVFFGDKNPSSRNQAMVLR